jgi:hypothetical protein
MPQLFHEHVMLSVAKHPEGLSRGSWRYLAGSFAALRMTFGGIGSMTFPR